MPMNLADVAQTVAFPKPVCCDWRQAAKSQAQARRELASCIATVFGATEHLAREVRLIVSEDQDSTGQSYAALIAPD